MQAGRIPTRATFAWKELMKVQATEVVDPTVTAFSTLSRGPGRFPPTDRRVAASCDCAQEGRDIQTVTLWLMSAGGRCPLADSAARVNSTW